MALDESLPRGVRHRSEPAIDQPTQLKLRIVVTLGDPL